MYLQKQLVRKHNVSLLLPCQTVLPPSKTGAPRYSGGTAVTDPMYSEHIFNILFYCTVCSLAVAAASIYIMTMRASFFSPSFPFSSIQLISS